MSVEIISGKIMSGGLCPGNYVQGIMSRELCPRIYVQGIMSGGKSVLSYFASDQKFKNRFFFPPEKPRDILKSYVS